MINIRILMLFICTWRLVAQTPIFESEPAYIQINADTVSVPVYVNGTLMGHTPFSKPIPVIEGRHSISHYPPSIQDPFISYSQTDSDKQIFVLSGDTVNVHLNTTLLRDRIVKAKKEYRLTNYAGIGLSLLLVWQLWVLAD